MEKIAVESFIDVLARDVAAEAVITEFASVNGSAEMESLLKFIEAQIASGVYMYFTPPNLLHIGEAVTTSLEVRKFVLGLYERFCILYSNSMFDVDKDGKANAERPLDVWLEVMIDTIVETRAPYGKSDSIKSGSILSEYTSAALAITEADLRLTLKDNPWLVVLYFSLFSGAYTLAKTKYFY